MPFVIIRYNPFYNDYGDVRHVALPCLVINATDVDKVIKFVDNANNTVENYKNALYDIRRKINGRTKQRLIDDIIKNPPWVEMVKIIGPKPSYNHSLTNDKEYNTAHVKLVAEWRNEFKTWATLAKDFWIERATELAEKEWDDLHKVEIDISHKIFRNFTDSILYTSHGIYLPQFDYVLTDEEMLNG